MATRGAISVEVVSDTTKFAAALRRELKTLLKAVPTPKIPVDADTSPLLKSIRKAQDETDKSFRGLFGKIKGQAGKAGAGIGAALGVATGRGFLGGLRGALGGIKDQFTKAIGAAGPHVQAALVAAVVGMVGALGPLVTAIGGTLPAAAAVGAAAIGTLTLGFQGLGDALDDADDPEKFAEALERLSPAAQRLAKELVALRPILKSIKDAAQEGLFKGFEGELTSLLTTLQGPLRAGFNSVGREIQGMVRELFDLFESGTGLEAINKTFETTARIIDTITPSVQIFTAGILRLIVAALPLLEKLITGFAGFLERIGIGLDDLAQSGELQKFFSDAGISLDRLAEIVKNFWLVLEGLGSAVVAMGPAWFDFAEILSGALGELFQNEDFLFALVGAFKLVSLLLVLQAKMWANWAKVIGAVSSAIGQFVRWLPGALSAAGKWFSDLGSSIANALDSAVDAVGEFFSDIGSTIAGWASSVGDWFSTAWGSVRDSTVTTWDSILDFFKELPGRIGRFFAAIPGAIALALKTAAKAALQAVGVAIGLILFAVLELPRRIPGYLATLWDAISEFFVDLGRSVRDWIVSAWNSALQWLSELPGRIVSALAGMRDSLAVFFTELWASVSAWTVAAWGEMIAWFAALPGRITGAISALGDMLRGFFTELWADIRDGAVSGWNAVVDWVKSIPGQLASLGSSFAAAGKAMIRGLFNGLSSAGEFAGNLGSSVYGALKSSLNWAIRQINAGIARVDDVLPGSLPRIPQLADGGLALGRTLAEIGEAGREMVVPLTGAPGRAAIREFVEAIARQAAPAAEEQQGLRVWPAQPPPAPEMPPLVIQSDGTRLADLLVEVISKAVRVRGGNVQQVLSGRGGVSV